MSNSTKQNNLLAISLLLVFVPATVLLFLSVHGSTASAAVAVAALIFVIFFQWTLEQSPQRVGLIAITLLATLNLLNYSPVSWLSDGVNVGFSRAPILFVTLVVLLPRVGSFLDRVFAYNLDVVAFAIWTVLSGVFSPFSKSTALVYGLWLTFSLLLILILIYSYDNIPLLLLETNRVLLWVNLVPTITSLLQFRNALNANKRLYGLEDIDQIYAFCGAIVLTSLVIHRHLSDHTGKRDVFSYPLVMAIVVFTSIVSVILSGTRSAILALLLFFAVYALGSLFTSSLRKSTTVGIILTALAGVYFALTTITPVIAERYSSFIELAVSTPNADLNYSDQLRTEIWETNVLLAHKHPVTGVGLANSRRAMELDYYLHRAWSPHSTYIEILSETGYFGTFLFAIIVIRSIGSLLKKHTGNNSSQMGKYFILMAISPLVISATESNLTPGQSLFFPFWLAILLPRSGLIFRNPTNQIPRYIRR